MNTFKEYITEATKMKSGEKFIGSWLLGSKRTKVMLARRGSTMSDPVVVYVDGKEYEVHPTLKDAKKAIEQFK